MQELQRRVRSGAFFAAILALYTWVFPWLPSLRSPNELSRLYQARAIVEDHSLAVNAQMARHGPVGDLSLKDGRYYPNKAPGMSLLGAGVYALERAAHGGEPGEAAAILWLRIALCALPGALAAELLRRVLAARFDGGLAAAGAAVFALGTIMWPYSVLLMSHGPTAAAIVAAWWCIERRRLGLAGFLAGTAVLLEYTSAIALPGLAWYALSHLPPRPAKRGEGPCDLPRPAKRGEGRGEGWRAAVPALLGLTPPILTLALYHHLAFGSAFHTGYAHLVNPAFRAFHARGFMGVGPPSLRALVGSFLDPARGLFAWAPFLALGIPGLVPLARKDRPLAWLCGIEAATYALFTASFNYEAWGWVVGPRHITTVCAFLVPPALAATEWLHERGWGFAAAALALAGIAKLAVTVAVCPYLPEELTNPVFQLVLPLARAGLHSPTLVELGGTPHAWSMLVWLVVLAAVALAACTALAARPGASRALPIAVAWLGALTLSGANASLPMADHYHATRVFMARAFSAPVR
jgi:hypothetical protein